MADAEDAAGFGAGSQNPLGACGRESEWLFTEHVFACAKCLDSHFFVEQVRGHNGDSVNIGTVEKFPIVLSQVKLVRSCEWCRHLGIDIASGHHLETRAIGKAGHDLLAPPAKADNPDPDHSYRP
jgi:hypothetical protein